MEIITELTTINYLSLFLKIFTILIGSKAIISVFEWFFEKLGLQNKWTRNKRREHELLIKTTQGLTHLQQRHDESVRQSIRHDEMLKSDISSLTDTVNGIAATLRDMQTKNNQTKIKEMKSSLIHYYNKYKDSGEWSKLEKDAFWDLFDDYESRGGNGYIHSIVEPAMRELRESD